MEKIEVGEYVRTKRGIAKVLEVKTVKTKMYGKHDKLKKGYKMTNLIGKRVVTFDGHIGIVIKHFKPTGRDMTVHIKQDDGRIWYCPDYNIIEMEEEYDKQS